MPVKPTVATLAVQMDLHREEFKASQERSDTARAELGRKVDEVAACVRKGIGAANSRIDRIVNKDVDKERAFYQSAIKWALGTFGSIVVFLLGVIGYLIINPLPWAGSL